MSAAPPLLLAAHAGVAAVCLPLGAVQLWRTPRGDLTHRVLGRVWAVGMLWVAVSSFWIQDLRPGSFSLLHVLSVVTVVSLVLGVVAIRRGRVQTHRGCMRGSWFGLVGAFVFAVAIPARTIPTFVVADPGGAAAALAAVAVATAGLVGLGLAAGRRERPSAGPGGGAQPSRSATSSASTRV